MADKAMDKALEAQAAARYNAENTQNYMRDLVNWEKQVKIKDASLSKKTTLAKNIPPVRNTGIRKPTKNDADQSKQPQVVKEKPIPGSDFRAWDKYDVDKALADVDGGGPVDNGPADDENDAIAEAERAFLLQQHMGNEEKERGNAQFKNGKFMAAIECYSRGIELDPHSAVLAANRAMAYLKMKRYTDAVVDCTAAVTLDATYVKAWQRRATAKAAMGDLEGALIDFKAVLKLEPTNKTAKVEVKTLPGKIADAKEKARKTFRPLAHVGDSTTLSTKKSDTVLHRIPIEEIGDSSDDEDTSDSMPAKIETLSAKISDITTDNERSTTDGAESRNVGDPPAKVTVLPTTEDTADTSQTTATLPPSAPHIPSLAAARTLASATSPMPFGSKHPEAIASSSPPLQLMPQDSGNADTVAPNTATHPRKPLPRDTPEVPRQPARQRVRVPASPAKGKNGMTSASFESTWRRYQRDVPAFGDVLSGISPKKLPALIKNNLCPELLTLIIRCLSVESGPLGENRLAYLSSLAQVPRLGQTLMFLDDTEVHELGQVFHTLLATAGSKDDVISLAASFDIKL